MSSKDISLWASEGKKRGLSKEYRLMAVFTIAKNKKQLSGYSAMHHTNAQLMKRSRLSTWCLSEQQSPCLVFYVSFHFLTRFNHPSKNTIPFSWMDMMNKNLLGSYFFPLLSTFCLLAMKSIPARNKHVPYVSKPPRFHFYDVISRKRAFVNKEGCTAQIYWPETRHCNHQCCQGVAMYAKTARLLQQEKHPPDFCVVALQ